MLIALLVVTSLLREINDKTLELILATSVSRREYYFAKLLGFGIISFILVLLFSLLLILYSQPGDLLVWSVSYFCELLLVTGLSLVMVITFKQIPSALAAVFLFYVLSRTISSMVLIAAHPIIKDTGLGQTFITGFLNVLSWLLPSLDQYAPTAWLVYGADISHLPWLLGQTIIYLVFLSAVALFDFYRKSFKT